MSDDLKIIFLGTGAAIPSARRGMPSMAIQKDGNIMLCDCGEGTQTRLMQAGLSPSRISAIIISHLHGDHVFGLPGFLTSQQLMNRSAALTIVGPVGIKKFLQEIQTVTHSGITYPLDFREVKGAKPAPFELGSFQITARPLQHGTLCFGYRIEEKPKAGRFDLRKAQQLQIAPGPLRRQLQQGNAVTVDGRTVQPSDVLGPPRAGRTIAFCTDTRPVQNCIDLAKDCHVLIHDSTFSAADSELARQSLHSAGTEAAQVALKAHARQLVLWHVSMRYDELQEQQILKEAKRIFAPTVLAQDFLEILLSRRT